MKMSIVTASLNQGPFIRDCIESVRRQQSAVAWEHIIADGGSTDETLAILESYEHLSWKSEPDEGQSDAFNKGQHQASGDWIIWLNADDFLMPGALDAFAAAATRDPSADGFYSDYYYVDAEGRVLKRRRPVRFNPSMVTYIGPYVPTSGSVYHRRIFESGILLDKNFRICMDRDFLAHLGSHGFRLEHVRGYFSAFREHGDNVHLQSVQGDVERREERRAHQRRPAATAPDHGGDGPRGGEEEGAGGALGVGLHGSPGSCERPGERFSRRPNFLAGRARRCSQGSLTFPRESVNLP